MQKPSDEENRLAFDLLTDILDVRSAPSVGQGRVQCTSTYNRVTTGIMVELRTNHRKHETRHMKPPHL